MKKIFLFFLVILTAGILWSCNGSSTAANKQEAPANAASDSANFTTIHWIDSLQDFGTVKYGEKVNLVYSFENSGNKPLFITEVRPTCGCTIADYTKGAVLPGEKGQVKAQFDSHHGVPGSIRKSIVVSSNTTNDTHFVLAFTGTVTK